MTPRIGLAQHVAAGEICCGDVTLVLPGEVLTVVLADGAGHGPPAAAAAREFCDLVASRPDEGLEQLLRSGSEKLGSTRGAAVALLRIDTRDGAMQFAGVGNIEVQAVAREHIRPVSMPGVVGRRFRKLMSFHYRVYEGDLVVMYSDGISRRVMLEPYARLEPQAVANRILAEHGLAHDDATCLALRV